MIKVIRIVEFIMVVGIVVLTNARPIENEKSAKNASVYVLGNLYNAAVSHGYSKTQAASDRNESEWNNTEMISVVKDNQNHEANSEDPATFPKKGSARGRSLKKAI